MSVLKYSCIKVIALKNNFLLKVHEKTLEAGVEVDLYAGNILCSETIEEGLRYNRN